MERVLGVWPADGTGAKRQAFLQRLLQEGSVHLAFVCFMQLFSCIKKITSAYECHLVLVAVQRV